MFIIPVLSALQLNMASLWFSMIYGAESQGIEKGGEIERKKARENLKWMMQLEETKKEEDFVQINESLFLGGHTCFV